MCSPNTCNGESKCYNVSAQSNYIEVCTLVFFIIKYFVLHIFLSSSLLSCLPSFFLLFYLPTTHMFILLLLLFLLLRRLFLFSTLSPLLFPSIKYSSSHLFLHWLWVCLIRTSVPAVACRDHSYTVPHRRTWDSTLRLAHQHTTLLMVLYICALLHTARVTVVVLYVYIYACVHVCVYVCVSTHICHLTHWNHKREIPMGS